jgi:ribonucleoside-diphosphate reductase alpha chain
VRQLSGIGGGRSLGFGPNRVRSLPDGVGQVLDEYLNGRKTHQVTESETPSAPQKDPQPEQLLNNLPQVEAAATIMKMGDLCPECGEATMVNEEGCRKCYTCGYSEC